MPTPTLLTHLQIRFILFVSYQVYEVEFNLFTFEGFLQLKVSEVGISCPIPLFLRLPLTSTEICPPCFKNKVLQLCTDLYSLPQLHIDIKAQMLFTVIVPIQKTINHPSIKRTFWFFSTNSFNRGFRYNEPQPTFNRCFAEDAEKFTKNFNARAQPLFCSLNLLFSDVLVPVAVFLDPP